MNRKKVLIALGAIALLGGLAWGFWPAGEDPVVARIVELQAQVFTENTKMPQEERRKAFDELRTLGESLTPEQRNKIMRDNPPPFARQMQQMVVGYFDLPPEQKTAALDKTIDEWENRRKQWEKQRGERGDNQGQRGPGGPGGGPPGGGRNMDPAQRNQFRKQMLDNSTPQQRAMFTEYFRDLQQRRNDRGMPPMGGPR